MLQDRREQFVIKLNPVAADPFRHRFQAVTLQGFIVIAVLQLAIEINGIKKGSGTEYREFIRSPVHQVKFREGLYPMGAAVPDIGFQEISRAGGIREDLGANPVFIINAEEAEVVFQSRTKLTFDS